MSDSVGRGDALGRSGRTAGRGDWGWERDAGVPGAGLAGDAGGRGRSRGWDTGELGGGRAQAGRRDAGELGGGRAQAGRRDASEPGDGTRASPGATAGAAQAMAGAHGGGRGREARDARRESEREAGGGRAGGPEKKREAPEQEVRKRSGHAGSRKEADNQVGAGESSRKRGGGAGMLAGGRVRARPAGPLSSQVPREPAPTAALGVIRRAGRGARNGDGEKRSPPVVGARDDRRLASPPATGGEAEDPAPTRRTRTSRSRTPAAANPPTGPDDEREQGARNQMSDAARGR